MYNDTDTLIGDACAIYVNEETISFLAEKRRLSAFAGRTILKRIKGGKTAGMPVSKKRVVTAVIAAVLILALSACALVPSVRNAVKELFTMVFTGGIFVDTGDGAPFIEKPMLPTVYPEGFERTVSFYKGTTYAEYTDGTRKFTFTQLASDYKVVFRGNGITGAAVEFGGMSAEYYEISETASALMWSDGEYRYLLSGEFLSFEELAEIAESVAPYEE